MYVQWCVKGVAGRRPGDAAEAGIDDAQAQAMLSGGSGISCNWWRRQKTIEVEAVRERLTPTNLHRHLHDYESYKTETPFISLTAGCVERDAALKLNRVHQAEDIALRFATDWGTHAGYLFHCWVIVSLKPAVGVEMVAEAVRDLNVYMRYSDYQLEGEIAAKIIVPANQIERVERWECDGRGRVHGGPAWVHHNPKFDSPAQVSNLLDLV